ncbi:MAG: peptide chain release factor 1, partial [Patescibacteria group bacterium]|nr:peptide chain release factor 1 [Patescibacteria group bacterium]
MKDLDISKYKENNKTRFLAEDLSRLLAEEEEIKKLAESDPALAELSLEELKSIESQKENLIKQMDEILAGDAIEEEFPNEIILEVRAGAGGDEASLFAEELANMYKNYCLTEGWQWIVIDESKSSTGGYKEASFEVHGRNSY